MCIQDTQTSAPYSQECLGTALVGRVEMSHVFSAVYWQAFVAFCVADPEDREIRQIMCCVRMKQDQWLLALAQLLDIYV